MPPLPGVGDLLLAVWSWGCACAFLGFRFLFALASKVLCDPALCSSSCAVCVCHTDFLKDTKHIPATGPLHMLFCLSEALFPRSLQSHPSCHPLPLSLLFPSLFEICLFPFLFLPHCHGGGDLSVILRPAFLPAS